MLKSIVSSAAVLALLSTGCTHTPKKPIVVTVDPHPWLGPTDRPVSDVANGYRIIVPRDATSAMFPCSLAVARVVFDDEGVTDGLPEAMLAMRPIGELMDWMELFDDIWSISEVFPITYPRDPNRVVDPFDLVDRAGEFGARLCFVYRLRYQGEVTAEIWGVLYDTDSARVIAAVHSDVCVTPYDDPELEPPLPADRVIGDRRHIDARFIAENQFRESLRSCVLDLIDREQGPTIEIPPATASANTPAFLSQDARP